MLGIFSGESGDMFFRFFKQYLIRIFEAELKDELKKVDVPNNYLYHHISCSFIETLRWWIQSGMFSRRNVSRRGDQCAGFKSVFQTIEFALDVYVAFLSWMLKRTINCMVGIIG